MATVLKNILSFTGLVVGAPSAQPHLLNIDGVAKVPRVLSADGAGFTITADATNVTVTRGSSADAAVNINCELWHSIEDSEPLPNGIATSLFPFVVQGGGSGGGAGGIRSIIGGTVTVTATGPSVVFSNGGGITWGFVGNTLTASVQTAGGTATGVGFSAGTQSADTGVVRLANSNGLTWGMSGSSQVTASFSTAVFSNSNNVSFGLNGSTITATATIAATVFSNSNNVSFGLNGSTITATATFAAETPFGLSAGTQSISTGTLVFSNSNGVTFGMSGSSRITASYSQSTAPNAIAINAAGSVTAGTIVFSNSNNITFGLNGSTVTATATFAAQTMQAAIAAVGGTITSGTASFANGNGVSFGINGQTITASVAAGAAAVQISAIDNGIVPGAFTGIQQSTLTRVTFLRMAFPNRIDATQLELMASYVTTAEDVSMRMSVYTMAGSTASRVFSASRTFSSVSVTGFDRMTMTLGTWSITPGDYLLAIELANSNNANAPRIGGVSWQLAATNAVSTYLYFTHGLGVVAERPGVSIHVSEISHVGDGASPFIRPYIGLIGTM